jgi:hypothetical protein
MAHSPPEAAHQDPLVWSANENFPAGKGATVQEFVAVVGGSRYMIDVAPRGRDASPLTGRMSHMSTGARTRRSSSTSSAGSPSAI